MVSPRARLQSSIPLERRRLENPQTEAVLNQLRTQFPNHYEVAEVVGKWIWLALPAKKQALASALWCLGFHWNQRRSVWQHPCGKFDPIGLHPTDRAPSIAHIFPLTFYPRELVKSAIHTKPTDTARATVSESVSAESKKVVANSSELSQIVIDFIGNFAIFLALHRTFQVAAQLCPPSRRIGIVSSVA